MPTDVVMPQMGESITEGTLTKWLQEARRHRPARRAALRNLHRQGRRGDSLARRRHAAGNQDRRGRHRPDQHRRRGHRRRRRRAGPCTARHNFGCPIRDSPTVTGRVANPSSRARTTCCSPAPPHLQAPAPAPTSSCRRWASPSPRAPSPSGSRGRRHRSSATSRSSKSPPTRSTPKFRRPPPASSPKSSSPKAPPSQINTSRRRHRWSGGAPQRKPPAPIGPQPARRPCAAHRTPQVEAPAAAAGRRNAPLLAAGPQDRQGQQRRPHPGPGTGSAGRITKDDILGHLGRSRRPASQLHRTGRAEAPAAVQAGRRLPPHLPGEARPHDQDAHHHRRSAWSSPSRPARTSTPSSRWT